MAKSGNKKEPAFTHDLLSAEALERQRKILAGEIDFTERSATTNTRKAATGKTPRNDELAFKHDQLDEKILEQQRRMLGVGSPSKASTAAAGTRRASDTPDRKKTSGTPDRRKSESATSDHVAERADERDVEEPKGLRGFRKKFLGKLKEIRDSAAEKREEAAKTKKKATTTAGGLLTREQFISDRPSSRRGIYEKKVVSGDDRRRISLPDKPSETTTKATKVIARSWLESARKNLGIEKETKKRQADEQEELPTAIAPSSSPRSTSAKRVERHSSHDPNVVI